MGPTVNFCNTCCALMLGFVAVTGAAPAALAYTSQPLVVDWLALRADIEEVQNSTGNAFALRGGWSPSLQLRSVPVGLRLLVEYGALRTTRGRVFSVPSVQLLATWAPAERLELAVGAGAQFWAAPKRHDGRLVVSLEAHYVPQKRWLRVIRSGFAAVSIGASSTSGLQARMGLELRFGRARNALSASDEALVPQAAMPLAGPAAPQLPACPPCLPCPACPAPPVCPQLPVAPAAQTVVLPNPVLFAFDSAHVRPAGAAYLTKLGQGLAAHSGDWQTLALTGHANAVGPAAHNLVLSVARARAVADVLERAGVAEDRLTISGVGATQPIAGSAPTDASQQRVMLVVLGGHLSPELQALLDGATLLPKEPS